MSTYSYSRLSTFEKCPGKYKFQYIDHVKTDIETSVEAFLGSMVHETLEKLYIDKRFMIITPLPDLIEFFNRQWDKNWNENILIVREERSVEDYKRLGEKYITDYYNHFKPFDQDRTIALETVKIVPIDKNYRMHIRIDRLALADDGTYNIRDFKTSNYLPTQDELDKDKQLAIYAYGVRQMYPDAKKIKLIWHYLAFDKELVSVRTDEQIEDLRKEIIEEIKHVESAQEFPYQKSALCSWCQFQPICPEFAHKFATKKLEANEYLKEDGVVLVNKYSELHDKIKKDEQELAKVKEALFKYAKDKNYNAVDGSSVIATIRSYPRLSFPKKGDPRQQRFFAVLRKAGLWDKLETADVYELAKMINKGAVAEDVVKKLDEFIIRGKTDKVYLRRK